MHLCIFNHRLTRHSDVLNDLVLRLSAQPYSRLVGDVVPLTVSLHPPSGAAGICLLGLFCLIGLLQTPWTFGENLRTPLHYWGFPFPIFFVRHFSGGSSEVVGGFYLTGISHTRCLGFPSTWSSLWYPLLFLGWYFPPLSSGGFLWDLVCPKRFPVFSGLQNSWETAPLLQAMSWEVFSLTSCLLFQWQIIYLGMYSLLSNRITLVAVFTLHYVEEEIIK